MEDPEHTEFEVIYIFSPLYDRDLSNVISSNISLSPEHVKYFVYQIACALKYIHSGSILHRDMKPANCLVTATCDLTLCDFGLARYVDDTDQNTANAMTEYVITRWFRPPELVLSQVYSSAVDMWALGCIFAQRKFVLNYSNLLLPRRRPKSLGHRNPKCYRKMNCVASDLTLLY